MSQSGLKLHLKDLFLMKATSNVFIFFFEQTQFNVLEFISTHAVCRYGSIINHRRHKNKQIHQRCLAGSTISPSSLCNVGPVTASQLQGLTLRLQQHESCSRRVTWMTTAGLRDDWPGVLDGWLLLCDGPSGKQVFCFWQAGPVRKINI